MTVHRVRPATPDDAAGICRIYKRGIEDRLATLETELLTPQERRQWLASRSPRHPVIVAEAPSGEVVGWGSLSLFNTRDAYRFVADISVYVERRSRGQASAASCSIASPSSAASTASTSSCSRPSPSTPAAWRSTRRRA
ncbi:MAG: GNAT family N-acetyltransferase [Candidatus Rokubacteria bacterium]|nr:GNAT family N-acetyltransferase [Candidatus Rokubacteria bacterium]